MRSLRLSACLAVATLAVAVPAALADPAAGPKAPGHYLLGAAVESIDPSPAQIAAKDFYLGGYGLSSGKPAGTVDVAGIGRYATGVLRDPAFPDGSADGVHVRAVVIGAGDKAIALAQVETQGMFAAYKQGPFGLVDIRRDAAAAAAALNAARGGTGPELTAPAVLVDSNHTHAGPDTAGVWGGVPTDYLKHVHDQTVKAIVDAYAAMVPVDLSYGTAHAGVSGQPTRYPSDDPLLTNQFSADPANQEVDDELRVLQARSVKNGKVVATYLNFSAHPTVLGGGNRLASGDYTAPLNAMLDTLGGTGMEQVGTLGRTQPSRGSCPDRALTGPAADVCMINTYASRVFARTRQAIAAATPLTGNPVVALSSFFVEDTATNAPIVALTYGGYAAGAPIYRAANAPWMTGTNIGSPSFSGRIGDLLLSGGPGEMYPQIVQTVRETVPARGHLNLGTAGDFLGYIVAPFEAYPEPLRRSLFDGSAPPAGNPSCGGTPVGSPAGCPSPIDNDNYFFNASHTFGERLTCSLLRGAGEVLTGSATTYWSKDARCPAFANDLAVPAGTDTTFPAQPDLSSLPGFQH